MEREVAAVSNPINDRLETMLRDIQRLTKATLQTVPVEISAYVSGEFEGVAARPQTKRGSKGLRKAASGRYYWNTKNTTNHLRRQYGNLIRALQVGGKGNVSRAGFDTQGNEFVIEHTYDESTIVNAGPEQVSLLYATIHERGDRPFLEPGMKQYLKKGWPKAIRRLTNELAEVMS